MDLAYSKDHINTFVVVSGDSDFSPLVSKLKELGKHVMASACRNRPPTCSAITATSSFTTRIWARPRAWLPRSIPSSRKPNARPFALLLESLLALRRENKEVLWSSMVKDTMKRKKPSFNEAYHGYRTFSELLEDAQKEGLLELEVDKRSRTYVVTRFGSELKTPAPPRSPSKSSRRRRPTAKRRPATASRPPAAKTASPEAEGLWPVQEVQDGGAITRQAVAEVPPPPATPSRRTTTKKHLIRR